MIVSMSVCIAPSSSGSSIAVAGIVDSARERRGRRYSVESTPRVSSRGR